MANEDKDIPIFQRFQNTMSAYQDAQKNYNEEANKAYDKNLETINRKTGESFDPIIGRPSFPDELKQERSKVRDIRVNQINPLQEERFKDTDVLTKAGKEKEKAQNELLKQPDVLERHMKKVEEKRDKERAKITGEAEKSKINDLNESIDKLLAIQGKTGLDFSYAIESKRAERDKLQDKLNTILKDKDKKLENLERTYKNEDKFTKTNYFDLSKEQQEAYRNAGYNALKQQIDVINDLKETKEFKGRDKVIENLQKEYWTGIKELAKKEAPYAIRNAFMIIDLIQKSLQNVGRALPKSKYSPAYTETPMEEPELYKLWREQIEKQQDFKQKTFEQQMGSITDRLADMYQLDKKVINDTLINDLHWDQKWRELGFSEEEALKNAEIALKVAKYKSSLSDEELNDLYDGAIIDQILKGQISLHDARVQRYYANHAPKIDHVLSWFRLGEYGAELAASIIDNIPIAKFHPAVQGILGALKGIIAKGKTDRNEIVKDLAEMGFAAENIAGAWEALDEYLKDAGEQLKAKFLDAKAKAKAKDPDKEQTKAQNDLSDAHEKASKAMVTYINKGGTGKTRDKAEEALENYNKARKKLKEFFDNDTKENGTNHTDDIAKFNLSNGDISFDDFYNEVK